MTMKLLLCLFVWLRQRLGEIMALRFVTDRWPVGSGRPRFFVVRRWLP